MTREFQFDDSFKEQIQDTQNKEVPYINIRPNLKENGAYFQVPEQYEVNALKFSKKFAGYTKQIEIAQFEPSHFTEIIIENEHALNNEKLNKTCGETVDYGYLFIDVIGNARKSGLEYLLTPTKAKEIVLGTCVVSLLDAFKKDNVKQDWSIKNGTEEIGSISLFVSYFNQNCSNRKEALSELINSKMFLEIITLKESALIHLSKRSFIDGFLSKRSFIAGLETCQNIKAVLFDGQSHQQGLLNTEMDYYVEIKIRPTGSCRKSLLLSYNDCEIGDILTITKEGCIRCPPIQSITKDAIVITCESREEQGVLSTRNNDSNKMMINVSDIPWSIGKKIKFQDFDLSLEIRSTIQKYTLEDSTDPLNAVNQLLRVMYFVEVCEVENTIGISCWGGSLGTRSTNIISIIRPLYNDNQWRAMIAWALLELRITFHEISSKISYSQLKHLVETGASNSSQDIYSLGLPFLKTVPSMQEYIKSCVNNISKFHERDVNEDDDIEEIRYMIYSLQAVLGYDNIQIKDNLKRHSHDHIKEEIAHIMNPQDTSIEYIRRILPVLNRYGQVLKDIQSKFWNFAIDVWCPILSHNVIDSVLRIIEEPLNDVRNDLISDAQDGEAACKTTVDLYLTMKKLLQYGQTSEFQTLESNFFLAFSGWIKPWLDHIEIAAKKEIKEAVNDHAERKLNKKNETEYLEKIKPYRLQSFNLEHLDEIGSAICVVKTMQSIIRPQTGTGRRPWQDIFYPFHKMGQNPGIEFLSMLHRLFFFYVNLLEEDSMQDNEIGKEEYANIIMSVFHVQYQYLDDFYKNEIAKYDTNDTYSSKVEAMQSEVMEKVYSITDSFCFCQEKYFKIYLLKKGDKYAKYRALNQEKTIGAHIDDSLTFFKNKRLEYGKINEESLERPEAKKLFHYLKSRLFKIETQMINCHFEMLQRKAKHPNVQKDFLDLITSSLATRRKFDFNENEDLENIKRVIEYKFLSSFELISQHLKLLHEATKYCLENTGSVKYTIFRVESKIYVHLKAVDFKPKEGRDRCDFKIDVLLLPDRNGTTPFCTKKQTNVYYRKRHFAFEIEDPKNTSSYQFDFDLESEADERNRKKNPITQYIELNLYKKSAYIGQYFRGHVLVPLNSDAIPQFSTHQESLVYTKSGARLESTFIYTESFDYIQDKENEKSQNVNLSAYNELKLRHDEAAKRYLQHRKKQHKN